jgi:hypothetical protein
LTASEGWPLRSSARPRKYRIRERSLLAWGGQTAAATELFHRSLGPVRDRFLRPLLYDINHTRISRHFLAWKIL